MTNEQSWVLTGGKVGGIWVGRRRWETEGEPASVEFPWQKVIKRHRQRGDVLGFAHTHPNMTATPSYTDIATMQAWVFTLGQPLLCVIAGHDGIFGYLYDDDESIGRKIAEVADIGYGIIIGLEHGRATNSRDRIPRQRRHSAAVESQALHMWSGGCG